MQLPGDAPSAADDDAVRRLIGREPQGEYTVVVRAANGERPRSADVAAIRAAIGEAKPGDVVLLAGKGHERTIERRGVDEPWDEAAVARTVVASLGVEGVPSSMVVSSSMPIRDIEWFGTVTPGVTVHSNRGANGIDGVVSTAVGIALATGQPTVLYIGDVAMVHDSNGLWGLMRRAVDVTIIVTNNDGGSTSTVTLSKRSVHRQSPRPCQGCGRRTQPWPP